MKLTPWRKLPITIRAACVGGVFVLLGAVVTGLLSVLGQSSMPISVRVSAPSTVPQTEVSSVERARTIIEQYFDVPSGEILDPNIVWCNLLGAGSNQEFYAKYRRLFTDYVVVFTTRNNEPENLYFATSKGAVDLGVTHVTIDEKTYFVLSQKTGSGGYLDVSVFDYDGIGKLRLVHKEEGMFYGHLYVIDGRVYIAGNSQRHELKLSAGEFELVQYTERLTNEIGSGCHALSYHIVAGRLVIKYDGDVIQFRKRVGVKDPQHSAVSPQDPRIARSRTSPSTSPPEDATTPSRDKKLPVDICSIVEEVSRVIVADIRQVPKLDDSYVSETPIILQLDEQILVDDNITGGEPQQIRLLCSGEDWAFRDGFFRAYVPRSKGLKEFSISHNYGDWYDIRVRVE